MKIFNSQRKNLLPGKGFKKYILYAIGEIFLVAIGILIALTVNNRNEQNKSTTAMEKTAHLVLTKMKKDTAEIKDVLRSWNKLDTIIDKVLYQTNIDEPIDATCSDCFNILFYVHLPEINESINDIVNRTPVGTNSTLEYELFNTGVLYKDINYTKEFYHKTITNSLVDNFEYLKSNKPWFSTFMSKGTCEGDCLDYFTTGTDFRNRVAYLTTIGYDSYYLQLVAMNNQIAKQIGIIERELGIISNETSQNSPNSI